MHTHQQLGVLKMAEYEQIAVLPMTKRLLENKKEEINKEREKLSLFPLNYMELTHKALSELTVKQCLK